MKRTLVLSIILLLSIAKISATHNRAGEITIIQTNDLSIEATITTYTKASSIPADRDSLEIFWGDGSSEWVLRSNGDGENLGNDTKKNLYTATHTYPGRASFVISMMDPNRNGGILNVNPPNSENVPFYLETRFTFLNTQFQGYNNTPQLLQAPIDFACTGQTFIHNPNAFDADGDSLSYALIVPFQDVDQQVPNYSYPDDILPSVSNQLSLNPTTGNLVWQTPQLVGEYNVAFRISEYRNGVLLSSMIRDMQVFVLPCLDSVPNIEAINEICVVAGEKIDFDIIVTDTDLDPVQKVALEATGGPFEVETNPAVLNVLDGFQNHPINASFTWQTDCNHIAEQYYTVVLRAYDNSFDTTGLADLHTVRIKVTGPPPENLVAESEQTNIVLNWDAPYECEDALDDYFYGFSVWRKIGSNVFEPDTCNPGLAGRGYEIIEYRTNELNGDQFEYTDFDVEKGITYCYRVLGNFAKLSAAGNPYNVVESLSSQEICIQLIRDLPLITHVDVQSTGSSSGEIEIRWEKPKIGDFDTIVNPGPYEYRLLRADDENGTDFTEISGASFATATMSEPIELNYVDSGLDTRAQAYTYKIDFYNNGSLYGSSASASSVYLSIVSSDRKNILSWDESVPWVNYEYVIYNENISGVWDSIGVTDEQSFVHKDLINDQEYCYEIKAVGSYTIDGVPSPLYNYSQFICGSPIDTVPPCPTNISANNICTSGNTYPSDGFYNEITWQDVFDECGAVNDDIHHYNIYFAPNVDAPLELIFETTNNTSTSFQHTNSLSGLFVGCYAVTVVDSLGNESVFSNISCLETCPEYELPNVFTPNNDGANDLFIPVNYRFIERIDLKVFNRWGQLVFATEDPNINWDGTNTNGTKLHDGTYYYVCDVYENSVDPNRSATVLSGFISLLSGQ